MSDAAPKKESIAWGDGSGWLLIGESPNTYLLGRRVSPEWTIDAPVDLPEELPELTEEEETALSSEEKEAREKVEMALDDPRTFLAPCYRVSELIVEDAQGRMEQKVLCQPWGGGALAFTSLVDVTALLESSGAVTEVGTLHPSDRAKLVELLSFAEKTKLAMRTQRLGLQIVGK